MGVTNWPKLANTLTIYCETYNRVKSVHREYTDCVKSAAAKLTLHEDLFKIRVFCAGSTCLLLAENALS